MNNIKLIDIAPWQLGLPHSEWRVYQQEAYSEAHHAFDNHDVVIVEAPVGIGKTAIAGALADNITTTVLVQNLGLLNQYADYGFAILMGKNSYPCVLPDKVDTWKNRYGRTPTAGDCHHVHNMYSCSSAKECPYINARDTALSSPRMACTYKFGVMSESLQKRDGMVVMDEIHNGVREFLGIDSFVMTDTERDKYDMPQLPLLDFGPNGEGDLLSDVDKYHIIGWTQNALSCVSQIDLFEEMTPLGTDKRKIFNALTDLQSLLFDGYDIFYKCSLQDSYSRKTGAHFKEPVMEIKALSPMRAYRRVTEGKEKVFMMSATIGDPTALICSEFGITDWYYSSYPHPVPPEKRPIFDIAERAMSHSNLMKMPGLYKQQAERIAKWINEKTAREHRGIVLTTSNIKIKRLREYLPPALKDGRSMFRLSDFNLGLQERIDAFVTNSDEGVVHVDTIQGWGTGVDLRGDIARYSVVAGVPLPNPTDRFDQLRFSTPSGRAYAHAFAYNSVMQATGRVTRGEQNEEGVYLLNQSALADKMATAPLAMNFCSDWFKEAIVND